MDSSISDYKTDRCPIDNIPFKMNINQLQSYSME